MKLRARLQRLERTEMFNGGCLACRRRRGTTVTVFSEEREDGTVTEPEDMPVPCERCGAIPEQIIHIVAVVVASPAAARDQAVGLPDGQSSAEVIGGDPSLGPDPLAEMLR